MAISQRHSDLGSDRLIEQLDLTGRRLDWLVALASSLMVGGAWLDAWSHHKTQLESFFTRLTAFSTPGSRLLPPFSSPPRSGLKTAP